MAARSKAGLQRKVITVKRKGKTFHQARMVRSEQAPAQPSQWKMHAANIASVALPVLGGLIGETLGAHQGAHHIENFGNRLAEHGRSMGASTSHTNINGSNMTLHASGNPTMGRRAGSLALRGVGTLLSHQSGNIGSMIGGSLGTSLGGALGHGAVRLLMHKR